MRWLSSLVFVAVCAAGCSSGAPPCHVGNKLYAVGQDVPSGDCNSCSCTSSGVACTTIECGDGGSQTDGAADAVLTPACMFDDTYKFGSDGGFVAYLDEATLAPPDHYRHVRTRFGGSAPAESTCAPALPACGTANVITARDVVRDLANADVRAAFAQATPPFFGVDTRPVDGVAFKVTRADGHGFFVGNPCGPPAVDCRAIPPGVQTLVDLLKALDQQQLANAECAAVTKP